MIRAAALALAICAAPALADTPAEAAEQAAARLEAAALSLQAADGARDRVGALTEVVALPGLTNHRIGEDFISGGLRNCGTGPEMITADADWRWIVATRLVSGRLISEQVAPFDGPGSFAPVLDCAR